MADEIKMKIEEEQEGTQVYSVPFPKDLSQLKDMAPIVIKFPWQVDYIHSYGQDSPWFAGVSNKKLLATKCMDEKCGYVCATPRLACPVCGKEMDWIELPQQAKVHTFTVCHFGSETFLPECPFVLALIEWEEADTLFLTRLLGVDPLKPTLDWIGMKVQAKFLRLSKFKPTDVYFVPAE
ncbi:Zn-ribbon domain-containing OB-fold protein [bacterium]|nr:Zn-ribbon domain-containing OB-fold protein [bacterium]